MTDPDVTDPDMTDPDMTDPDMTDPDMNFKFARWDLFARPLTEFPNSQPPRRKNRWVDT